MAMPTPEVGMVLCYSYLWGSERRQGREEGRKDRPCVVVLVVELSSDARTWVTVLPVTHLKPDDESAGLEIPNAVKRHLGLDDERSWVVVSEGDQFVWPGYDLRKVPNTDRYDYGFLPPKFFKQILLAFRSWHRLHKATLTRR